MGLHGALFDSQGSANFFIRTTCDQHLQHLLFAIGERHAACRENAPRGGADSLDEHRENGARKPTNRSGSLSTTAMRIGTFLAGATAADFIAFPFFMNCG